MVEDYQAGPVKSTAFSVAAVPVSCSRIHIDKEPVISYYRFLYIFLDQGNMEYAALINNIRHAVGKAVQDRFRLQVEEIKITATPTPDIGDLAIRLCFQLAKTLKKAPIAIGKEILETLDPVAGVKKVTIEGGGYLNFHLDRWALFSSLRKEDRDFASKPGEGKAKIIVEHTNINPNKAAHIGHLRNACLGDTLVRLLRFLGEMVEVQNYIDDTGVQVADVVVGFHHLLEKNIGQIREMTEKFDYFCWDLYARVTKDYQDHPEHLERRNTMLAKIEEGNNEMSRLAAHIADRIVQCHLRTMERINIRYDLMPRESDIMKRRFWDKTFSLLKEKQAIFLAREGKQQGCWVMRLKESTSFSEMDDPDKIIVRSNGTVTYVGKDIAYQLWKFGLLGSDFLYSLYREYPDGHALWMTDSSKNAKRMDSFGKGTTIYNVIDVRQSYLQKVVKEGLKVLGYPDEADRSIHFSYEMVALSLECCRDLGVELGEEERSKSYLEMAGRRGLGIKADDLLDRLIEKAREEVKQRAGKLEEEERGNARKIAVGALRYFMIKNTRNKVIAFDLQDALSFTGETGPYLMYSAVRAGNIFKKLKSRFGPDASEIPSSEEASLAEMLSEKNEEATDLWEMILLMARIDDYIETAVKSLELSYFAKYVFQLAQKFNNFYHKYSILNEPDPKKRDLRMLVAGLFLRHIRMCLSLMGIEAPEKM